ncbi:MAG: glycosyl transferase family 1 [Candidatus Riflebacteria bacterium HGW-Riflebacteria-1]|jgi:glycosyltransferase involved in cell wall biosynthesis|nr:MAG: glycosyl transferase family 1 [Candidatus Riflebacteria bacterium HGW-Riflebacteria-1]
MNILIFTNTFTPHVGGVARSVEAFTIEHRKRGHRVLVVAPEFPDMPPNEVDVIRIEAIQNFNASDFSLALPLHSPLTETVDAFQPDIVHSQHPFLLGMTALRLARYRELPLVFTHHTLYEHYTHYVPGDSSALERFAMELATRYSNLTDQVFTPSESIRDLLQQRGVTRPIAVVPTGVLLEKFAAGDGRALRRKMEIPDDAFVIGHLGRLAPEKNLEFLAQAVADFLRNRPEAHFLVVGTGPSEETIRETFARAGVEAQLHHAGSLRDQPLADALHAMDVFAFASKSETQGMVLTEAMAAGLPVVAIDAPGVREVVTDGKNGRLLQEPTCAAFSAALQWMAELEPEQMRDLKKTALDTAEAFSISHTADKALAAYASINPMPPAGASKDDRDWEDVFSWMEAEWEILKGFAGACGAALSANLSSEK